jgi:hypothetical protein
MIFDLTDEDRAALEAHRVRLGCRSHAETLRWLIRGEQGADEALSQEALRWTREITSNQELRDAGSPDALSPKQLMAKLKRTRPQAARVAEHVNRLKGQWKAP